LGSPFKQYRFDFIDSIIKDEERLISKYLYIVSRSLLYSQKIKRLYDPNISDLKKKHTRVISYKELRRFLLNIGYKDIKSEWFKKSVNRFLKSRYVETYDDEIYVIKPFKELIDLNHDIMASIILSKKESSIFKTFTYRDFVKYSVYFLYGKPQSVKYDQYNNRVKEMPIISQKYISKALKITQSRVNQIVDSMKKVYIFEEIDRHEYMFNKLYNRESSYVTAVYNVGLSKRGNRYSSYLKLLGTKLFTNLKYRSIVRGNKLPHLINSKSRKYRDRKLYAPKIWDRVTPIYFYKKKTVKMDNNDMSMSSYKKLYSVVTTNLKEALYKVDILFRTERLYHLSIFLVKVYKMYEEYLLRQFRKWSVDERKRVDSIIGKLYNNTFSLMRYKRVDSRNKWAKGESSKMYNMLSYFGKFNRLPFNKKIKLFTHIYNHIVGYFTQNGFISDKHRKIHHPFSLSYIYLTKRLQQYKISNIT